MEMRNLEGSGMGKGIMLPSRKCKKSKRPPACRSCFPVVDLLGWLKDLSSSGDSLVPLCHPVLGTCRGGSKKGSEGAGQGGPSPVISVLGFARGELWKAKEENMEMAEVGQGQRVLCEAVSPPWVRLRTPCPLLKGHPRLLMLLD